MKRLIHACMLMLVLAACGTSSPSSIPIVIATNSPPATAEPPGPTPSAGLDACVTNPTTEIRQGPGTEYDVVGGIVAGTCLTVLQRNADSTWLYIRTRDNQTGWIDVTYMAITPPSIPITGADTDSTPANTPSLDDITPCTRLANQVNSNVVCKIKQAACEYLQGTNGSPTFCFDQSYPGRIFQLVVFDDDWSDYDGHCLIVSGYLEAKFDGQRAWLQMKGYARSQVSDC